MKLGPHPQGSPIVLHVLEAFATGVERHLLDLVDGVTGFDHVVVSPRSHLGQAPTAAIARAAGAGATVEIVDMRRSMAPVANARALRALRAVIRGVQPSLIHGHSSVGGAFARAAALGSATPVVYTPNGIRRSRPALAAERILARRTDVLIAVSQSEGLFATQHGLASEGRLEVIPNGIDPRLPRPLTPSLRSRLAIPPGAPLVGGMFRLSRQKAPEVYVAACARVAAEVPDCEFLLIGEGPEEPRLSEAVAATGLGSRFHRLRSLPRAAAALGDLDVCVLTSRYEGCPYVVLEAMRAGVPVVATAADGTRDIVADGVTGIVAPIDDDRAVAAATVGLLRDPTRRENLGAAGRRRVADRFDVRPMAAATAGVYSRLIGARTGAGPVGRR